MNEWIDDKGTAKQKLEAFLLPVHPPHPHSNKSSALTIPGDEEALLLIIGQMVFLAGKVNVRSPSPVTRVRENT